MHDTGIFRKMWRQWTPMIHLDNWCPFNCIHCCFFLYKIKKYWINRDVLQISVFHKTTGLARKKIKKIKCLNIFYRGAGGTGAEPHVQYNYILGCKFSLHGHKKMHLAMGESLHVGYIVKPHVDRQPLTPAHLVSEWKSIHTGCLEAMMLTTTISLTAVYRVFQKPGEKPLFLEHAGVAR